MKLMLLDKDIECKYVGKVDKLPDREQVAEGLIIVYRNRELISYEKRWHYFGFEIIDPNDKILFDMLGILYNDGTYDKLAKFWNY